MKQNLVSRTVVLAGGTAVVQSAYLLGWPWLGLELIAVAVIQAIYRGKYSQDDDNNPQYDITNSPFYNTLVLFVWSVANAAVIVHMHIDAPRKQWILGGLFVASALTVETFRGYRHSSDTGNTYDTAWYKIVHAFNMIEKWLSELIIIAFIVAAVFMYAELTAIPWSVPWVLFVIPIGYVIYRIVLPNRKQNPNVWYFFVMVVCVLIVTLWPANFTRVPTKVTCPGNRNIGVCGGAHMGDRVPQYPGCCCLDDHFLFGTYGRCTQCQAWNSQGLDCCGNEVNATSEPFLGGPFQCVCSQTPSTKVNVLTNNNTCECNTPHTCGNTCEYDEVSTCGNATKPKNPCHEVEEASPNSVCLLIG